jgi:hypothetical protein
MAPASPAPENPNSEKAIPLICPGCSTSGFSDLSHLLTHFLSKSHVLHREKLRILSPYHQGQKEKHDEILKFHEDYNIDCLLANRLMQKDEREKEVNKVIPKYHSKPSGVTVSRDSFIRRA